MSHHPTPRESHLAHEDSRNEAAQRLRDATRLVEAREEIDRLTSEVEALKRTPLHELVDLCREQGLALDFALYGPDEGQHPDSDDTKSTYLWGARITGRLWPDPMDAIRAAIFAREASRP